MAVKCPVCNSTLVQQTITGGQCLSGGHLFDNEGKEAQPGAGASTRAAVEATLRPRQTVMVGNLADLQLMGARDAAAAGRAEGRTEVVTSPPAVNPITPAEHDAQRAELFEAVNGPANPDPRPGDGVDVVDPGSQSPQRIEHGSNGGSGNGGSGGSVDVGVGGGVTTPSPSPSPSSSPAPVPPKSK